jgi:signal transduction histidine kinase
MHSFSSILLDEYAGQLGEEALNLLQRVKSSAERMDQLIHDLLDYSRVNRAPVESGPVELEQIVRDALRDLETVLGERDATVRIESPLPVVCENRSVLLHVVANLLSNAAKFARPGVPPEIRIFSSRHERFERISIQDNGIGIAPAHQERIFRIFERLNHAAEVPGTGVGLAIVQKSIERLGGRSGVDSVPGQGSTFWIELPSVCEPELSSQPPDHVQ